MSDPTEKEVLVISRHWDHPMITVRINSQKIEVEMDVKDFCKAVVAEIPHPFLTLTRSQLEKQVLKVLDTVLNKVKESTAHV